VRWKFLSLFVLTSIGSQRAMINAAKADEGVHPELFVWMRYPTSVASALLDSVIDSALTIPSSSIRIFSV
jgi:hypothetical protein